MPGASDYPDFLSTDFFATAIASDLKVKPSAVQIIVLHLSAGSKSGENFCSEIYRAVVTYSCLVGNSKERTVSLIVKAMPYTEGRGPVLEDLQVFDKEVTMYSETLPNISKLLGGLKICAKLYYAVKDPVMLIVFEDLKASGFRNADRTSGIDEAHCDIVINLLGKLHAASMVISDRDTHAMEQFQFGLVYPGCKPDPVFDSLFVQGLKTVIELSEEWSGFEDAMKRIKPLMGNFLGTMDLHCNHSPSLYKVLNHGDCWVNNMMFKYNEVGRPTDLVFIDFQMSFYSSPGIDFNYFVNTSPTIELRTKSREKIFRTYYNSFSKTLRELHHPRSTELTAERVLNELESREFYGFFAAVSLLPLIVKVPDDKQDMSLDAMADAAKAAEIRMNTYRNPVFVEAIKGIIRRADDRGVFAKVKLAKPL